MSALESLAKLEPAMWLHVARSAAECAGAPIVTVLECVDRHVDELKWEHTAGFSSKYCSTVARPLIVVRGLAPVSSYTNACLLIYRPILGRRKESRSSP